MRPNSIITVLILLLIILCSCAPADIQISDEDVPKGGDVIIEQNLPSDYPASILPLYKSENLYFVMSDGFGGTTISFTSMANINEVADYYENLAMEYQEHSKEEIENQIMLSFRMDYYFVNIGIKKFEINSPVLKGESNITIMISRIQ